MTTFNDSVPSFLGGVSQQAAALRSNNVVDDAVNVEALPTEGLTKRYPSIFEGELTDPSGASLDLTGARFVALERDDEDYILALGSDASGDGYVYAWQSDGTPVPCEDSDGILTHVEAYLDGTTDTDIRTQQVADALFVSSRAVTVVGGPGDPYAQWQQDNPGAGYACLQGSSSLTYNLKVKVDGMTAPQTFGYSTPGSGLVYNGAGCAFENLPAPTTGGPTDLDPATRTPFFFHNHLVAYDTDEPNGSLGSDNWKEIVRPESVTDLRFYYHNSPSGVFGIGAQSPASLDAGTMVGATAIDSADFKFDKFTGACIYTGTDANVLNADRWLIRQVRNTQVNYGIEASDVVRMVLEQMRQYFDGSSPEKPQLRFEVNYIGLLSDKTDALWNPLTGPAESNAIRVYFEDTNGDDVEILEWEFNDAAANDFTSSWQTEVDTISDLPVYWKNGAVVKTTGATISTVDDDFIEFVTTDGVDIGRGIWRETVERGLPDGGFDASTMPITIQRTEDGSGGYKFVHGVAPWATRQVGDDESAKEPSFVGSRITDVFFHENRLGFLAGPGMVLSESGEFYNFWRTTLVALPESDPVDVTLANLDGDTVYHAVPYDSRLFVFSEDGQAAVTSQGPLGPTTIEAPVVSKFHVSPTTAPVVQGRSMFLSYVTGDYTQVRQVVPGQYQSDYQDAQITIGVPQYIPSGIKTIAKGMSSDAMVFLTGDSDRVFVYQYLQSGGQQVMNAWMSWEFAGSTVVDCVAIQDELFFGMVREGKTYLESMRFGMGRGDTATDFEPRLDRRVGPTTGTYDIATDTTVFQVDFDFSSSDNVQASASEDGVLSLGTTLPVVDQDPTTGTLSVRGDVSGQPMVLGIPFESRVVMSKPYFKAQSPRGGLYYQVGGRQLCRSLHLHLSDTGYTKATVDVVGSTSASEEFLGDVMGQSKLDASTLRSGDFRIPINADVDDFRVTLTNDSAFPSTIVTGAWTLRLNRKKSTR